MEITKICTLCKTPKPLDMFWRQPKGKYGVYSRCKACQTIETAKYYRKNAEKIKARSIATYRSPAGITVRRMNTRKHNETRRRAHDELISPFRRVPCSDLVYAFLIALCNSIIALES